MKANGDYYKHFLVAHPGGGTRRNPKRKNAGSFSTKSEAPSTAEVDAVFEGHLTRMAKGGTYGDNMEIVAFSEAFNVNVIIYKKDVAFVIKNDEACREKTVYIAHHVYLHCQVSNSRLLIAHLDIRTLFIRPECPWSTQGYSKHRPIVSIRRGSRRSQRAIGKSNSYRSLDD